MSALALPTRSQCAEDRVLPNDAFTQPQRAQAAGRISLATKLCSTVHGCQYSRAPERTPAKINDHRPVATHNSTSARWASKSSTGRNCRRCSVHGNIQDCRNSTARRYTSILEHTLVCRRLLPSDHKPERCCSAADDSRAGSRSHANDGCAARERARRTQWLAAATRELHLMRRMCGTLVQHTRSAMQMRQSPGLASVGWAKRSVPTC
jgi:hypothetical protein